MAATLTFDVAAFRAQFVAFASAALYPDELLQLNWDTASCYISTTNYGRLTDDCRQQALNLMTAHITTLSQGLLTGQAAGVVSAATIDKVQVTLQPPPQKSQFQWWCNLTPYGAQLYALLSVRSVGGVYIGGRPEKSAFRGAYGILG